jgi:hypothetical protein
MKITIKDKEYELKFGIGFMERAIKEDQPEGQDIMQLPTQRLLYHALAYADERNGIDPQLTKFDVFDYLDEVGLNSKDVKLFQVEFFKSMRVNLPDNESKKAIDEVVKALTPEGKKKVLKIGKKTGK